MSEKYILLEDRIAYKQTSTWGILNTKAFTDEHIVKGSLLVTLTDSEVSETSSYFTPPLRYKKYSNDSIKLWCEPERVLQLNNQQQFDLLLGVRLPFDRYKALKILNWAEKLIVGFGVKVAVPTVPHPVIGVIQYIGTLPDEEGTKFGIELLERRGQGAGDGTLKGTRYFKCDRDCGMFVAMDKLSDIADLPNLSESDETITQSHHDLINLEDQVKQLQIDHNSHDNQITAFNNTVDKHKTDIQRSTERIEVLERALVEMQAQLSLTQKQLSDVQKNNEMLQISNMDLKNQLSLTQQQLLGVQSMMTCSRLWVVSHDQFTIGKEIGRGAWATVHEATFRGATVAAKCLHEEIVSPEYVELFHREMQMALHCQHHNIVTFLGVTLENHPVILMELMDINLRIAYKRGNIKYAQILGILHDIANALHFLHTRPDPVIHRDVSSANVLLKAQYNGEWLAKLGDLGTAKIQQHTTTPGPGTPAYAAPEVADPKCHSTKMDVYSFGILLVEILTKTITFQNLTTLKVQVQQQFPQYHQLVTSCTNQQSSDRPTMYDVIGQLNMISTV